ncbi:hypothetical protein B0A50_06558 [Salinomyces thailandicus]|uniref:CCCH zinc finger and RRM domain-containing protein n=1 Tax=Salinomyces thailandicus TaxID=706561 RepID=A0A4V5N3S6_9PEZI|nr:hypothetical protein B0A50_06558 [Salinomyces thailandica]
MHFAEADSQPFKKWIVTKLENISDADSDVLADYVLALVKTDDPEPLAKANCVEQLQDFLGDSTASFVADAFLAIATRSYDPSRPTPKPTAPIYAHPRQSNESRKRSYHAADSNEPLLGHLSSFGGGDRPAKQARRGGRGHESRGGRQFLHGGMSQYGSLPPYTPHKQQMPALHAQPPGMPPFDPNDPMGALIAMGQLLGLSMPPMPDGGFAAAPGGSGQRCRDYDTKGFCVRGVSCPHEHGDNPYVVPHHHEEYDPMLPAPVRVGEIDATISSHRRGAGRGRGRAGARGGSKRSEFSDPRPNHDKSITTIVVEQIPEGNFDEQSVRGFFGDFGNVEEVTLQPFRRLAIVKYDTHEAAKAAYSSPKSIFDNRFVKVHWYKPEAVLRPPPKGHDADVPMDVDMQPDAPNLDPEEIARKQNEAQRRHEELKQQREGNLQQRQEVDGKLNQMEQERKKLAETLARRTGEPAPSNINGKNNPETSALKEQLAKLEAEAKSLGIDPDDVSINGATSTSNGYAPSFPRGRGGYRGRRAGRGSHLTSSRGAHASTFPPHNRSAMSLDNRPKTLVLVLPDGGLYQDHEESLRQYLMFNNLETATLAKHPDRSDAALVTFRHRYEGENVLDAAVGAGPLAASDFRGQLGKVELSWYTGVAPAAAPVADGSARGGDGDAKMEDVDLQTDKDFKREEEVVVPRDMDTYDEEDMDRWG